MLAPLNVLGGPIATCSRNPLTGWFRDGCCNTSTTDHGSHTVCCRVTTEFLEFLKQLGNDLMTPAPEHGFPGLTEGDQWCVCASSWVEAWRRGKACPVHLEGTHAAALQFVSLDALLQHAITTNES